MVRQSLEVMARANMIALVRNPYPGRGLLIGRSSPGYLVQVYWIMGRSENSRNRVFSADGGRVYTEPADPSKVRDPSLIIYDAMDEVSDFYVVSNGNQTGLVLDRLQNRDARDTFLESLEDQTFEPDAPNFTPRITGICSADPDFASLMEIVMLRKSRFNDVDCDRLHYQYNHAQQGFGYCITTYMGVTMDMGNDQPLPSFTGEPFLMPLDGDIKTVAETYWAALNEANRVSLAVKFIDVRKQMSNTHLINKYQKV